MKMIDVGVIILLTKDTTGKSNIIYNIKQDLQ